MRSDNGRGASTAAKVRGTRILVIGGGVVGVVTAATLARHGLSVTLVERSADLAAGVTARNGAQLSYSYCDPIGSPSVLRALPRLLAGFDPAFRIHPSASPAFVRWGFRFLSSCRNARFRSNLKATLRLALLSRSVLHELRAGYPELSFDYASCGKVHVYDCQSAFDAARALICLKNELGCNQRALTVEELLALEPALSACRRRIVGAVYSPIDEAGDPATFTRQLAALAQRQHALTVLTNTHVDKFVVEGGRIQAVQTRNGTIDADAFILAAGCGVVALAAEAGIELPVMPMKGYSVTLPATSASPALSVTDARAKIVFCRLREQMRIAGMAELGRADDHVDQRRIATLLRAARAALPAAAEWSAEPNAWSGLRPMTPDSRPIVSRTSFENLFLNCGHGMLGWTLACGSAQLVCSMLLEQYPTRELRDMAADFSLARFTGGVQMIPRQTASCIASES